MDDQQAERALTRRSSKWKLVIAALIVGFIASVILSLNIGYQPISFKEILLILGKLIPFSPIKSSSFSSTDYTIITLIRLPRVLSGALVGAGLAVAGVIFQGIFRNPMADPFLLGASAGASVGYAIAVLLGVTLSMSLVGLGMAQVLAFIFALIAVFFVVTISRVGGKIPTINLVLSGMVISIFLLAILTIMELRAGRALIGLVAWTSGGGFSNIVWTQFFAVLPIILVGIVLTYFFTRDLNVLAMGEETAQHLGINTERTRLILLAIASLITAACVAISGVIGFVGLIIPHMTRLVIGPDHRILLPASAIVGAIYLVMCDALVRVATGASELPVGVITALIGAPVFFILLRTRKTTYSM
jgi:iron complex transport system permease protein